jgi:hypothetical protein
MVFFDGAFWGTVDASRSMLQRRVAVSDREGVLCKPSCMLFGSFSTILSLSLSVVSALRDGDASSLICSRMKPVEGVGIIWYGRLLASCAQIFVGTHYTAIM